MHSFEVVVEEFLRGRSITAVPLLVNCSDPAGALEQVVSGLLSPSFDPSRLRWVVSDVLIRLPEQIPSLLSSFTRPLPFPLLLEMGSLELGGLLPVLSASLGSDLSAWEAFWSLADAWEGSLGDLLDASLLFSAASGAPMLLPPLERLPALPSDEFSSSLQLALDLVSSGSGVPPSVAEGVWLLAVRRSDRTLLGALMTGAPPTPQLLLTARSLVSADLRCLFMECWAQFPQVDSYWTDSPSVRLKEARRSRLSVLRRVRSRS